MTIKEFKVQYALGTLSYGDKMGMAGTPSTSKGILTILSREKNHWIRVKVAYNVSTPIKILTKLSKDESSSVRCWIARNRHTTIEVLTELSEDEDMGTRDSATFRLRNSYDYQRI